MYTIVSFTMAHTTTYVMFNTDYKKTIKIKISPFKHLQINELFPLPKKR